MALLVAALAAAVTAFFVARIVVGALGAPAVVQEALEASVLFAVEALREGRGLAGVYPPTWTELPLIITPYPPLFHLTWAGLAWILGSEPSYLAGRVIADLALAACVLLIYGSARELGSGRIAGLAFALAFLTPVPVIKWAGVARVDVPGLALTLLGLWLYLRMSKREGRSYLWCVIPFALAGLTKQTFIAAPAAVIIAELVARRYRRAATLALLTGGIVVGTFAVFNMLTDGGFFRATFGSFTKEVFYWVGLSLTGDFVTTFPIPGLLFLIAIVPLLLRRFSQPLALIYLGTALAVLALTVGKPGANVNYFIEPAAALCIAAAAGWARIRDAAPAPLRALTATAVAVAMVWGAMSTVPDTRVLYRLHSLWRAEHASGISLPESALRGGPILAPPSTYTLLPDPRPLYYLNDDYTFGVMAARGKFPPERILEDLRNQHIAAVIAIPMAFSNAQPAFIGDWQNGWTIWSVPGYRDTLLQYYEPVERRLPGGLLLLLPSERSSGGPQNHPSP